jgi:hypothetical protein
MSGIVNVKALRKLMDGECAPQTPGGRRQARRRRRSSKTQPSPDSVDTLGDVLDRLALGTLDLDAVLAAARSNRRA